MLRRCLRHTSLKLGSNLDILATKIQEIMLPAPTSLSHSSFTRSIASRAVLESCSPAGTFTSPTHPTKLRNCSCYHPTRNQSTSSYATTATANHNHNPLPTAADALDPERTTETLGYTWLTHWKLIEEDHQFRQIAFQSTRGRQLQRRMQLAEEVGLDTLIPGTSSTTSGTSSMSLDDPEVRIVNGRISVVDGDEGGIETLTSIATNTHTHNNQLGFSNMDELTWLASHPSEETGHDYLSLGPPIPAAHHRTSSSTTETTLTLPGAVQLQIGTEQVTVRPLWISIYQEESSGVAKLFESVVPLQPEIVDKVTVDLTPLCSVSGLSFGELADLQHGAWMNYFVGLVGDVAVDEDDILWPNQILHRDRVLYNVRDAGDVARFLSDPRKEDVEAHALNLKRLATERGYRRGWCWYMLRSRWGLGVLKQLKNDIEL